MENRRCTDAARATLLGVFTMLGAGATRAQVTADWDIHPPPTLAPSLFGQWEGPYDLGPLMVTGGHVAEIGHAVYLADGEFAGQVMFWNVPDDDLNIYAPRSFIWDPDARDPINVTAKAIPALLDATEEPFCGGHVPLSNGDILSLGGLNFSEFQMLGSVRGVRAMFLFSLASQTWQRVWNGASIVELNQEWYYPSALRAFDGDVVVVGHFDSVSPSGQGPSLTRERFLSDSMSMDVTHQNAKVTSLNGCAEISTLPIFDYAKTTFLSDGTLMWIDAENRMGSQNASDFRHVSRFIDLIDEDCPGAGESHRWTEGVLTTHPDDHAGGNAVHYVLRSSAGFPNDVIYNIGGTRHGEDDNNSCTEPILDLVERFTYDATSAPPEMVSWDESLVPLRDSRKNSNAVILLDGSILVLGGLGIEDVAGGGYACEARLRPERLLVTEIFGQAADPQWRLMAPQQQPRVYHSVALLLADGRVILAGGQDYQSSSGYNKSLEIYKPPYCFRSPRPAITDAPVEADYQQTINVEVDLPAGNEASRVALLATGSVTHAMDWNQRYVDLNFSIVSQSNGSPLSQNLAVTTPPSALVAPPGYYFLTVVDDHDIPSPAVLLKLGQ